MCVRAGMDLGSLSQMMGTVARKRSEAVKETAELKASFVDPRLLPGRGLVVAGRSSHDEAEADTLEREVAFLQSEDASQRRAALSRVMLLAQNPDTNASVVNRVWEAVSLELVRLMSDDVERIRDMALRSLIAFLDRVTAVVHVLPVAVPGLLHRMGTIPTEEPAEEVRLLLVLVLGRLVSLLPKNVGAYMDAIQGVLECALVDVNPAVRKEACGIIVMLCRVQREQMRKVLRTRETRAGTQPDHRYEDMIKSLKGTIRHKHASVRVTAVSALGALLMCGEKNMNAVEDLVAWHQPNIIPIWTFFSGGVYEDGKLVRPDERATEHNYLALLGTDKSPQVREAFLHMLVDWMTRLADRWDHEMRFLPYLLNGLTDDVPKMREVAFEAMERLGATHESEKDNNERDKQELRDFREYGHKTPAEQNAAERWRSRAHEPPFTRRPRLGARMVVRSNFRRLCPTLLRELNDWLPRTRSMSAQLLYYLSLYCEYWVTDHAIQMVEAIVKCIFRSLAEMETGDPDARQLLRQVLLLTTTIGEFIDPSVYMPLLLPVVRGETETDIHHRCAAIEVLRAMCEGCSPSWLRSHASVIVLALDCPSIWESRDPRLSTQVHAQAYTNMRCRCVCVRACMHACVRGEVTRGSGLRLLAVRGKWRRLVAKCCARRTARTCFALSSDSRSRPGRVGRGIYRRCRSARSRSTTTAARGQRCRWSARAPWSRLQRRLACRCPTLWCRNLPAYWSSSCPSVCSTAMNCSWLCWRCACGRPTWTRWQRCQDPLRL